MARSRSLRRVVPSSGSGGTPTPGTPDPAAKVSRTGRYTFTLQPTVKGKTKLRVIMSSKPGPGRYVLPTVVLTVR